MIVLRDRVGEGGEVDPAELAIIAATTCVRGSRESCAKMVSLRASHTGENCAWSSNNNAHRPRRITYLPVHHALFAVFLPLCKKCIQHTAGQLIMPLTLLGGSFRSISKHKNPELLTSSE